MIDIHAMLCEVTGHYQQDIEDRLTEVLVRLLGHVPTAAEAQKHGHRVHVNLDKIINGVSGSADAILWDGRLVLLAVFRMPMCMNDNFSWWVKEVV